MKPVLRLPEIWETDATREDQVFSAINCLGFVWGYLVNDLGLDLEEDAIEALVSAIDALGALA